MSIFLRIIILLLIALAPVIISTSCSKEDDIEEIFMDKSFYINGATIQGTAMNEDVKQLYQHLDSYYITFGSDGTFSGKLDRDCIIGGRWSADGKKKSIHFEINTFSNPSASILSEKLKQIFSDAKTYSGDANVVIVQANEQNFIRLSTKKQ